MSADKKSNPILTQVIAAVIVALLVGGSAPWWWPRTPLPVVTTTIEPTIDQDAMFDRAERLADRLRKASEPTDVSGSNEPLSDPEHDQLFQALKERVEQGQSGSQVLSADETIEFAPPADCKVSIGNPVAGLLKADSTHRSDSLVRLKSGDYTVLRQRSVRRLTLHATWYQIEIDGRRGWVDAINPSVTTSACRAQG